MADAEDSKSSVRKDMRVQVPPSAPGFFRTVLCFLARVALAVRSAARKWWLTLAEPWLLSKSGSVVAGYRTLGRAEPSRRS